MIPYLQNRLKVSSNSLMITRCTGDLFSNDQKRKEKKIQIAHSVSLSSVLEAFELSCFKKILCEKKAPTHSDAFVKGGCLLNH